MTQDDNDLSALDAIILTALIGLTAIGGWMLWGWVFG